MVEATQPKRIRIRTKASDTLSLARGFKSHLTRQSIFIKSAKVLQAGTSVTVELLYATGERAIYGEGRVSWARSEGVDKPAGLAIELEWDPPSRALVEQILTSPSLAPPPPLRRPTSQISSSTLPARPTSTPRQSPIARPPPGDFGAAFAEETSQHGSIVQIDEPTGRIRKADLPAPPPPSATPHGGYSLPPLPPPPRPPPRSPSVVPSAPPPPVSIPAPTQSMPPPTESMPAPPLVASVPPPTVASVPPLSASAEVVASELLSEPAPPAVIAVPSATADLLPFATADLAPATADLAAPATADLAAPPAAAPSLPADPAAPKGEEAWFEGKPTEAGPSEAPPAAEKKGVWGWFKKTFGGAPKPSDP